MEWRSKQPRDKVVSGRSSNRGKGKEDTIKKEKTNNISTSLPLPLHWPLPSCCWGWPWPARAPAEHLGTQCLGKRPHERCSA